MNGTDKVLACFFFMLVEQTCKQDSVGQGLMLKQHKDGGGCCGPAGKPPPQWSA